MSYSYSAKIDLDNVDAANPKDAVALTLDEVIAEQQQSTLNDVSKAEMLDHQEAAVLAVTELAGLVRGRGSKVSASVSGHGSFVDGQAVQSSLNVSVSRAAD